MRWPLAFLPLVFIATLLASSSYTPAYNLNLPSITFMGFQFMLMLYPIFQSRYFGFKKTGFPGLDFAFTQPISRKLLYLSKATIYFAASISFALTFLTMALIQPEARIKFPNVALEKDDLARDFFISQFPGGVLEAQPGDAAGSVVILPQGQVDVALAVLVLTWAGVVFYQFVLGSFRRESALQFTLQIGLGVGMLFGWVFLNISSSREISIFARSAAFISHSLPQILLVLMVVTISVQIFCANRFASREISQ